MPTRATLLPTDAKEERFDDRAVDTHAGRARAPFERRHGRDALLGAGEGEDREDKVVVCVRDRRDGAYFEILAEPYLALDVFYHPFAYRDRSTVVYHDSRLAA